MVKLGADYLKKLQREFDDAIERQDFDKLIELDHSIRSILQSNANENSTAELKALLRMYDDLTISVANLREQFAKELAGMQSNKKGIKAYRTS
ncbi:hypothetical protein A3715_20130 [Oleiphilus sp. HI0009]|uniref:hypothetical protein n=1 Tax=unclassified Oleiphilus TaxID=2631174 RepID=UPI0007C3AD4C|nr:MULTISPECIES: hypothetical protein [unclassified Oleiphilus]KZX78054.1 hypothetical protein A3715_11015 [Oleiphilus sp. HI0009]MCH2159286.1 hypothetical protein [Oleiphilaceae bacterium]KZX78397.1 hypothetical protein A3715_20130 [Oleiphilus sp. HI0009]KZY66138.1 hypothetical protein A3738_07195 [Oleiphilus sp. HI0066]KZY72717.1 hypothetical protein A3739_03235 [Oleiphilus sp. HI0067]